MSTAKMLFNSTISTKNGHFAVFDRKNFYLGTPMRIWEYMCIHISNILDSIISQYTLLDLVNNECALVEIMKGVCGLPQAESTVPRGAGAADRWGVGASTVH
jgi:hypothetical protein